MKKINNMKYIALISENELLRIENVHGMSSLLRK